jgi:hypothetical protein
VQHLYAWFPSYYCCIGLILLGHFHHCFLAINHACSAFCLHQRRAMFSDLVSVVKRCMRRGHNLLNTFSTTWKQCFAMMEHKCYAWGRSQTPINDHKRGQHWVCMWHDSFRQTSQSWWKWKTVCKLVMVLSIKSPTTAIGFLKSVQDWFQNNSECCIIKCTWMFANYIWITIVMNVTLHLTESSLAT